MEVDDQISCTILDQEESSEKDHPSCSTTPIYTERREEIDSPRSQLYSNPSHIQNQKRENHGHLILLAAQFDIFLKTAETSADIPISQKD